MLRLIILYSYSLSFLLHPGYAQKGESLFQVQRLQGTIELDGIPDEEAWKSIDPLPLVTLMPQEGDPPTEKTEILLAYDDEYIYLGGRLHCGSPEKLLMQTKKRDAMQPNSDYVGIVIDSYNDNENAMAFFTTPTGLRLDANVYNDAQSPELNNFPINTEWNTFWDAGTQVDSDVWYAEMRIPFTSLRYQEKNNQIIMGISVWRYFADNIEVDIFPAISYDYGFMGAWKPSQMQKVVFRDIPQKSPLYVTPYMLGGYEQTSELNESETDYDIKSEGIYEAGLDVKYGLTNNLTLDLTINTDFAQVEADVQQVNLTRFSLFYPEKRQFFLERSSIFNFQLGGSNQLFYSRRIGIDDGELVRIYGGARMVGRIGSWDLGLLDMQTAPVETMPTTNWGVLRLRRKISKSNSYIGAMVTNKINKFDYNTSYGLDGIFNITDDDYLNLAWIQTFDRDSTYSSAINNAKFRINWEKRDIEGFGYNLSISRVGEKYNPEMGFELRNNAYRFGNSIWYGWLPDGESKLLNHRILIGGELWKYNDNDATQSLKIGPGYQFSRKDGWEGLIQVNHNFEDIRESFSFSDDAEIPVGKYNFMSLEGFILTPGNKPVNLLTEYYAGPFYDGNRLTLSFTSLLSVSPTVELGMNYSYNNLQFKDRDQRFLAHLVGFRSLIMFSTQLSVSTFVQYNNTEDRFLSNFRFRYNPQEGNDLYIVYNEGLNTDRYSEIPNPPLTNFRTIALKYTYTFKN